jgi:hypothetical protein
VGLVSGWVCGYGLAVLINLARVTMFLWCIGEAINAVQCRVSGIE